MFIDDFGNFIFGAIGPGNDTLDGGPGNDFLGGGTGSDTYLFGRGSGQDTVFDGGDPLTEIDIVRMADDVFPDDVTVRSNQDDLVLSITGTTDQLTVWNFFSDQVEQVEQVEFADGTVWGVDTLKDKARFITGTDDAENLKGHDLNDVITGLGGDDILDGGFGVDAMTGGAGDDTYIVDDPLDAVVEAPGEGTDTVSSMVNYTLSDHVDNLTLQDRLLFGFLPDPGLSAVFGVGNELNNMIMGNIADNVLDGGAGDDTLIGGIAGFQGEGGIEGGSGHDILIGGAGNDTLDGVDGDDTLIGGAGDDLLIGWAGNDTYRVNLGDGVDTLADSTDDAGNVVLFGAGITPDSLSLGLGSLLIRYGEQGDALHLVTPDLGDFDPNDAYGPHAIGAFQFADGTVLTYSDLIDRGFDLTGTAGDDVITGTNVVDRVMGLEGADVIQTGAGDDVLDGGAGTDTLAGGAGDDTYLVDHASDVVTENAGEGTDMVLSAVSYVLGDHVEHLTLTGTVTYNGAGLPISGAVSATGNALDNQLTGNSGRNILDGGPGADLLAGGPGNDIYVVDNVGDVVLEVAGEGGDKIESAVSFTLPDHVESLALTGTDPIGGIGNAQNNRLDGNSAANVLDGGAGNDWLIGGAGDDTYLFNRGGGQDRVFDSDATAGNTDRLVFGVNIAPLDLIISRHVNDLKVALHGSSDQITVQTWYSSPANQTEIIQAGNGQQLLNTQVDLLIQAMAQFSAENGMTWDQAIDQRPQDVQTILAASWQ